MKRSVFMIALAAMALGACSKEVSNVGETPASDVQSFRDLSVPKGFDFSGTKSVMVTFEKQDHLPGDFKSVYQIEDVKGITLLKCNLEVAKGLETELEVPNGTDELFLVDSHGAKRALTIKNNNLIIKNL